jgi:hypothetical protein
VSLQAFFKSATIWWLEHGRCRIYTSQDFDGNKSLDGQAELLTAEQTDQKLGPILILAKTKGRFKACHVWEMTWWVEY